MACSASPIICFSNSARFSVPCATAPGSTSSFSPTSSGPLTIVARATPCSWLNLSFSSSYSPLIARLLIIIYLFSLIKVCGGCGWAFRRNAHPQPPHTYHSLPVEAFYEYADGASTGQSDLFDVLFFGDAEFKHLRLATFDDFQGAMHDGWL